MNKPFLRQVSVLSSLTVLTLIFSGLNAQAESVEASESSSAPTSKLVVADHSLAPTDLTQNSSPETGAAASAMATRDLSFAETSAQLEILAPTPAESSVNASDVTVASPAVISTEELALDPLNSVAATPQTPGQDQVTAIEAAPTELPVASTSASELIAQDPIPDAEEFPSPQEAVPSRIAPGRATRSGPSYIGVAGNIGLTGGTALGDSNFAVISKIGLSPFFSIRPSAVIDFEDDATILIPVTLDFVPRQPGQVTEDLGISIAPYFGGGAAISTDGDVGPLLTAGVDVPITPRFTANAAFNVGFLDEVDVGLMIGVGYNFPGLF